MKRVRKKIMALTLVAILGMTVAHGCRAPQEPGTEGEVQVQAKKASKKIVNEVRSNKVYNDGKKKKYLVVADREKLSEEVSMQIKKGDALNSGFAENGETEKTLVSMDLSKNEAKDLREKKGVLRVEKDGTVTASASGRRKAKNKNPGHEWNMRAIHADDVAMEKKQGQRNVRVAVIDSGMDITPDLNVVDRVNLVPEDAGTDVIFEDVTQHGTSVAAVIASKGEESITGINDQVDLYSVKVLDDNNSAPISRVIEGIYWAMERDVDIINMSFGTYEDSEAFRQAVKAAYQQGILIVAAAGNNEEKGVQYPAAYDEVIAVGSVNTREEHSADSAVGDEVELTAPGEQIKSLGYFGGEIIVGGTSMSAPHVTGAASLLWQKDLTKSNRFIRKLLQKGAKKAGNKRKYGSGIVDVRYSNDIYHQFSQKYDDNRDVDDIAVKDNESPKESFEDVNYVQGSWGGGMHQNMVTMSDSCHASYGTITNSEDWETIKWAAKIIDDLYRGDAETKAHMAFHGGGNYIASCVYLSRIANNDGSRSGVSKPSVSTDAERAYLAAIDKDLDNMTSNYIYTRYKDYWDSRGKYTNARYRSQIIWGFAIHAATDAYAHRAKIKKDGKWWRLKHAEDRANGILGGADDTSVCYDRYRAASQVARNIINKFNTSQNGTYRDFVRYVNYTSGFKLEKLYSFAEAVGNPDTSETAVLKGASWN